ncbi:uncharacterized protein DUF2336 [Roseibium hamelinense]|uniref:Uncharacterized protein DUF2336 n=1 Tax=Roseibium hamelinense TaxID=150831 RepID=A0A562T781_9HYPH|nr:DUF2336 domain-containing protein [Roseibium hamelinense]MTI43722.1 DUF2336 domain-containing protein [Roseibium hamelinense]TWI89405.1 uncharacterized protein DUF2336 [Roseibium hamelinense]
MLNTLIELAKEATPEKRRRIMSHVTDLFVIGADRYKTEELALFNDVLEKLLAAVSHEDRVKLSERLAPVPTISKELAMSLASDVIAVAKPMLETSSVLTTNDLVRLAKVKSQAHLLAISKRSQLEAALTDVLLERGERPVQQSVASNEGAELSKWGMKLLVKQSEKDSELRETMLNRDDISMGELDKLTDQLPEETRKRLKLLYKTNQELVEKLFREADKIVASSKLQRRNTRIDAKASVREIRSGQRALNKVFSSFALSHNILDLAYVLAELSNLEQKYVTNAILRPDIDSIAIICRALGVGDIEFSGLCQARCAHLKLPKSAAENWESHYAVTDEADARRALTFIRLRLNALKEDAA